MSEHIDTKVNFPLAKQALDEITEQMWQDDTALSTPEGSMPALAHALENHSWRTYTLIIMRGDILRKSGNTHTLLVAAPSLFEGAEFSRNDVYVAIVPREKQHDHSTWIDESNYDPKNMRLFLLRAHAGELLRF